MRIKKFKSLFEHLLDPDDIPAGNVAKDPNPKPLDLNDPRYSEEEEEEEEDTDPDINVKKKENDPVSGLINQEEEEKDDKEWTEEDEANFEGKEDMEHLLYLIRAIINNAKFEGFFISSEGWDLSIIVEMDKKDRLERIVKAFEIVQKIQKDLLVQYTSKFEQWESKDDSPLLVFNFELEKGDSDLPSDLPARGSRDYIQGALFPEEYHDKNSKKRNKRGGRSRGKNNTIDNDGLNYDEDDYDKYPFL